MMKARNFVSRLSSLYRVFSSRSHTPLLNDALRTLPSVRLISETGEDCGVMSGREALQRAKASNRDVMQVSQSETPVVRVLDFAAYEESRRKKEYERRKSRKESVRLQRKEAVVKQIRLSPSTDHNDAMIKMRKARQFLCDGYRVKVYMQFRRGQGRLSDNAKTALVHAAEHLSEFGTVQGVPSGGFTELFSPPKGVDEEEGVRRPLQILIQPFSRKVREQLERDVAEDG